MRVVATSDFHGIVPEDVPPCDLLIVAGDVLSGYGTTQSRATSLFGWLERQPAETIVGVAGNHDYLALEDPAAVRDLPWIYLQDEGCVVDGLKVWGSPWAKEFGHWAFMRKDDALAERWTLIPDDTEILVVHGPAYGILDRVWSGTNEGSRTLLARIRELPRLKLLVTGHIHEAYGTKLVRISSSRVPVAVHEGFGWGEVSRIPHGGFLAVNASKGFVGRGVNPPLVIEID